MMDITTEQLDGITRMAAAAYTPKQIAFAMGFKREVFLAQMNNEDSEICTAFFKGYYSAELAVRESAFLLARTGSSPAQTLAIKLFEDTRKSLKKDGVADEEAV